MQYHRKQADNKTGEKAADKAGTLLRKGIEVKPPLRENINSVGKNRPHRVFAGDLFCRFEKAQSFQKIRVCKGGVIPGELNEVRSSGKVEKSLHVAVELPG